MTALMISNKLLYNQISNAVSHNLGAMGVKSSSTMLQSGWLIQTYSVGGNFIAECL